MSFKNIIVTEIQNFKNEYLKINEKDFVRCDYKKVNNNDKCLIWIPGRNDYFFIII